MYSSPASSPSRSLGWRVRYVVHSERVSMRRRQFVRARTACVGCRRRSRHARAARDRRAVAGPADPARGRLRRRRPDRHSGANACGPAFRQPRQKLIVENRTGASGIATQAVAVAEPDGQTLLIGASPFAVNHSLFPDFPVRYGRDLTAVAPLGATSNVLVVHPSLNVRTLARFIEYVKERPGAVSYATVGIGSSSHLAGVAFDLHAGTTMVPVGYRAPARQPGTCSAGTCRPVFPPFSRCSIWSGPDSSWPSRPRERSAPPGCRTSDDVGAGPLRFRRAAFGRAVCAPPVPAERIATVEAAVARAMTSDGIKATLNAQGSRRFR